MLHRIGRLLIDHHRYSLAHRSPFDAALSELLRKEDFFFIQVGAHDGVRFDGLYQRITMVNLHGIVIEPLPRYFARLRMNYEDYPGVIALNVALHPTLKRVTIHHVADGALAQLPPWAGGIASVLPEHHHLSYTIAEHMTQTTVEAMTFEEILSRYRVSKVDLLQIDTEGFDDELLKIFPFRRIRPLLIKYEHACLPPDALASSRRLLSEKGYDLYEEGQNTIGVLHS